MALVQLATKIHEKVKEAMEVYCDARGLKMNRFIEDAILDKLEEAEDILDIKMLRKEQFKTFQTVLEDLKKHGKL